MTSPEFGERDILGHDLLMGINILSADVFLRSKIPLEADVTYSSIGLSRLTPTGEIVLSIDAAEDGGYIVILSENPRVLDSEDEIYEVGSSIGLKLQADGHGLAFKDQYSTDGMSLVEAAEYIIRRLPDLDGAAASIQVEADEVK